MDCRALGFDSSVGTEGVRLGGEGPGASASYCCYEMVDDIYPALPIIRNIPELLP